MGSDNDCDGDVDEGLEFATYYSDLDGDGWGDDSTATMACEPPSWGGVLYGGDCDDSDASINPGAEEDCGEEIDRNCDGSVGTEDADSDGVIACEDCNDADAATYPGCRRDL